MIEIRLATLVVIWFPKYLLTNKYMLDLKILHALGIATNMIILFSGNYTFSLRFDIFVLISITFNGT